MNEIYLKKLEIAIDESLRKKNSNFNIEMLVNFIISKINSNSLSEQSTQALENILIKLIQGGFGNIIKNYCYYLISTFNHELSQSFFSSIQSEVTADALSFDKQDLNLSALRNYTILNEKALIDNYSAFEQIFKNPKYEMNLIINSFYFSNFPVTLLDMFDKLNLDDIRSHAVFLKKFHSELAKQIFNAKLDEGSWLNLVKIIDKIISKFTCFKYTSTKEKIVNSIVINLADYLMTNLDEIIDLLTSFDPKLIIEITVFPINLYKIYNFYRDVNNPNKKYENIFHRYINFLFESIRGVVDCENFTMINKAITEFKIIDNIYNPQVYSSEIIELISKFLELCDNSTTIGCSNSLWFDLNMKLISVVTENIDYQEVIELTLSILPDAGSISNASDRIFTLFNFFYRLIIVNIDYSNYFEKESLILCLFKQDWFVLLIKSLELDERESRFRHDLFICLIEALYYAKIYILKNGQLKKFINWIKICLDIIDVCFKIIEWVDEGESYKMYFLVLEETCLFFDDPFYCFIYDQESEFRSMKIRLEQVLIEISKRFSNKIWQHISFANENSKYRSLLLLSQFLNIDNTTSINLILEVIFLRMNEIPLEKKSENFVEQILRSCLFLGIRVNYVTREKIIQNLANFIEKIKSKLDLEVAPAIINNIRSFTENILNYLLDHKTDPQIILDSKIVDKLNNDFYLIIPKDLITTDEPVSVALSRYNNLYLINICGNSKLVIDNLNSNSSDNSSSTYLDYFKKVYYYPILEYNNDYCHFAIDNDLTYKFSEWTLITGISDAIHIYYMYKINIDTREVELFIKAFNSTSCVLNNIIIHIYISKNLSWSHNYNSAPNKEFSQELLSPFSTSEFSVKFLSKKFDKNNINIDCTFDMQTDYISVFTLTSESFFIPLTDYFVHDNFCLYETKKFDIFYQTLEHAFTIKCFVPNTPEEMLKYINDRFAIIEFKSRSHSIDKTKVIMDNLKELHYKDFIPQRVTGEKRDTYSHSVDFSTEAFNHSHVDERYNFKIKLASYCVYNFWIYIVILGDYNFQNNKSILNIEVKSNDLNALNIISREKFVFFNELLNKQVKFY